MKDSEWSTISQLLQFLDVTYGGPTPLSLSRPKREAGLWAQAKIVRDNRTPRRASQASDHMEVETSSEATRSEATRSEAQDVALHRKENIFQIGIEAVRDMMQYQKGVTFTSNTSALKEHWTDENGLYYDAKYTIQNVSYTDGNIVSGIGTEDGVAFAFPAVMFLDLRTTIRWNPIPDNVRAKWYKELESQEHENSIKRAKAIMNEYIDKCKLAEYSENDDIIVILDGNGENRKGMEDTLHDRGIPRAIWPLILTFEIQPNVALANQLMFGKNIIFTGADHSFNSKSLVGKGGVYLEHLIQKQNRLYTDDMKARTKVVYFDYCGGPAGNQNVNLCQRNFAQNVLPHIPKASIIAMTMSYRKHPHLSEHGILGYICLPPSFEKTHRFTENGRVLCEVFVRREPSESPEETRDMHCDTLPCSRETRPLSAASMDTIKSEPRYIEVNGKIVRKCATPGCTLRDGHLGTCNDTEMNRRRTAYWGAVARNMPVSRGVSVTDRDRKWKASVRANELRTVQYKGISLDTNCAICSDTFDPDDDVYEMTTCCGGVLHKHCADEWFRKQFDVHKIVGLKLCPLCRTQVNPRALHAVKADTLLEETIVLTATIVPTNEDEENAVCDTPDCLLDNEDVVLNDVIGGEKHDYHASLPFKKRALEWSNTHMKNASPKIRSQDQPSMSAADRSDTLRLHTGVLDGACRGASKFKSVTIDDLDPLFVNHLREHIDQLWVDARHKYKFVQNIAAKNGGPHFRVMIKNKYYGTYCDDRLAALVAVLITHKRWTLNEVADMLKRTLVAKQNAPKLAPEPDNAPKLAYAKDNVPKPAPAIDNAPKSAPAIDTMKKKPLTARVQKQDEKPSNTFFVSFDAKYKSYRHEQCANLPATARAVSTEYARVDKAFRAEHPLVLSTYSHGSDRIFANVDLTTNPGNVVYTTIIRVYPDEGKPFNKKIGTYCDMRTAALARAIAKNTGLTEKLDIQNLIAKHVVHTESDETYLKA